jgi:hypothetical protein
LRSPIELTSWISFAKLIWRRDVVERDNHEPKKS